MSKVTSPEQFFGFPMGADRKMARWDKIVEYFGQLATESDCIRIIDMGPSTEGNPFLLAIITSAANLANLEHYRQINLKLADPRGLDAAAVDALVAEGKAVVCQSMSLHASEIGGTQTAPELAYDLLTKDDAETKLILDNVIFLMVPCFNPDGEIMLTDWYNKWLGTEYEGCNQPWLYHKYVGHDNNRDAYALNMPEGQYMGKILFRDWKPQAYQDHHHMMTDTARLAIAPYCDPLHPNPDPMIWRELSWYGAHMAYKLEEAGKTGIINNAMFPGWGHLGFHWITNHHNIAGMLTESASAKLASPLYIHPKQLKGAGMFSPKSFPAYEPQTNFPHPWPGGWWRLRDIVEQIYVSAWALLELAARHRETVLRNTYLKAIRQTERGAQGDVKGYAIRPDQHDPLTVRKLVQVLLNQGIEVKQAKAAFEAGNCTYPAGTWLVSLAQPKMAVVKTLLGQTSYIDNYFSRSLDDNPVVFDNATDNINEFMGVAAEPLCCMPDVTSEVACCTAATATVAEAPGGWLLDAKLNDSYRVVNRLLAAGAKVARITGCCCQGPACYEPGSFYVEPGAEALAVLQKAATELGVPAKALAAKCESATEPVANKRVGMYQRYFGGNADEGWTRFIFETWEFPYQTIMDADLKAGKLNDRFDVIILPADRKDIMVDINKADPKNPMMQMFFQFYAVSTPPEYQSGFGDAGVAALREFVANGGRLVTFGHSCHLPIDMLRLGVRDVVSGLDAKKFYSHGDTLRMTANSCDPLAWGMPEEFLGFSWDTSVFTITERFNPERIRVIASYAEENVLRSGWLIGEDLIKGQAAMVAAAYGKGEAVLIGFRPQHRAQTHGTYKLVFNCLY